MFIKNVIREAEREVALRRVELHVPAPLPDAVAACVCGHSVDDHDAVGRRYCAATLAAALPRGCICGPVPANRRA